MGALSLLKAAHFALMDLVDYFLSEGANIEERETSETSPPQLRMEQVYWHS
jgi:hypothetical protein